jgi:PIN domain nuclease of toxin-antitoxin system
MAVVPRSWIVRPSRLVPQARAASSGGRRKGPIDPAALVAFATAIDWELLPLTAPHAAAELAQPLGHKDPFDELLLVQAQEEHMRLHTRDAKLIGHPFGVAGAQE